MRREKRLGKIRFRGMLRGGLCLLALGVAYFLWKKDGGSEKVRGSQLGGLHYEVEGGERSAILPGEKGLGSSQSIFSGEW